MADETIAKQVMDYINQVSIYFKNSQALQLRDLSNDLIEKAVAVDNSAFVDLSLISYALSKLVSKPHLIGTAKWDQFEQKVLELLCVHDSIDAEGIHEVLQEIITVVSAFDASTGNYITNVIEKARIKQGSRAYALGVSLGKAAQLTCAPKSELMKYVGETKIHEREFTSSKTVADRYKIIKRILGE